MKQFLLPAILIFAGCLSSRVETEYGGNGDFVIQNKSSKSIRVEISKVSQLGGDTDTSEIIQPDSSKIILSDEIIGRNVTPNTSLTSMSIYQDSIGRMFWLYTQDPIDQSKWIVEKQYSEDFGHTKNTFVFCDSMICYIVE